MSESLKSMESSFEKNPTEREIFQQFEVILGNREFVEVEKTIDEEGLSVWEIKTLDEYGDELEISYLRGRVFPNGVVTESRITQTLYTAEGIPCGAGPQFDFIDGAWIERL